MSWVEIFAVFVVSHAFGDYLLQTDWQATNKRGGLGRDKIKRRALVSHVFTYTLAFVPAGVWLATDGDLSALGLVLLAVGIYVPHLVQDDGRLLSAYIRNVKGVAAESLVQVYTAVDQSFHLIILFTTAVIVGQAVS